MNSKITFKNIEHEAAYAAQGYFTTPFLEDNAVASLEQIFHRHFKLDELPSVFDTIATPSGKLIESVYEQINSVCQPFIEKLVSNYFVTGAIFIVKKSGDDSYKELHIDPSMTLEEFNNIGVWIPLCDVDERVGRMCLLPDSQHFLPPFNTPSIPCPYSEIEAVVSPDLVCFNMQKGEALFFNNSMLHCTEKNTSGKTRIAVVFKLVDKNAPVATVYFDPTAERDKQVSVYEQEKNIFVNGNFRSPKPLPSSRFVKFVPNLPKKFTAADYALLSAPK